MRMSDTIGELATALSQFQSEVTDAHKDSQAYQYKYADLGTVLTLIRPLMAANGLSLAQFPISEAQMGDKHSVGVLSMLMHKSGEWLAQEFTMPVDDSKNLSGAQQSGSVITYARRYSAAAILGITQVDNDAAPEQARQREPEPEQKPKMATEAQKMLISDFIEAGQMPIRTLEWLKLGLNKENLSFSQATKILKVCKEFKGENE